MTWYYDIDANKESMDIIDHTGDIVTTINNDGSGFIIPDDVFTVMRSEAEKARSNNNTDRWRDIHIRLADDDIALKE